MDEGLILYGENFDGSDSENEFDSEEENGIEVDATDDEDTGDEETEDGKTDDEKRSSSSSSSGTGEYGSSRVDSDSDRYMESEGHSDDDESGDDSADDYAPESPCLDDDSRSLPTREWPTGDGPDDEADSDLDNMAIRSPTHRDSRGVCKLRWVGSYERVRQPRAMASKLESGFDQGVIMPSRSQPSKTPSSNTPLFCSHFTEEPDIYVRPLQSAFEALSCTEAVLNDTNPCSADVDREIDNLAVEYQTPQVSRPVSHPPQVRLAPVRSGASFNNIMNVLDRHPTSTPPPLPPRPKQAVARQRGFVPHILPQHLQSVWSAMKHTVENPLASCFGTSDDLTEEHPFG